ncbi:MAG TPA: DUF389 domain-containing protein [Candidatus Binatia bacterium]|nr:DUF389 domain-containing protein [Candidatus Binatia bacterium]
MPHFTDVAHGSPTTLDDVDRLGAKLRFDEPPILDRYVRFLTLLCLSTIIATGGLIEDSTAVIIGAMIVAPLMTPMMAISLGMVMGNLRAIVRAFLTIAAGIVIVIAIAFAMASVVPGGTVITSEVLARTAPRLLDLVVAVAAGAAGAFALGREDVSDALPGVAIAVSLVPPLSSAGICLAAGQPDLAGGAFLLFFTNFVAIVAAGAVVLTILGYAAAARAAVDRSARRVATAVILVAVVVVLVPLGATSIKVAQDAILTGQAESALDSWLAGTGYTVISLNASGDDVTASIGGSGTVPPLDSLLTTLRQTAGASVTVEVTAYPSTTYRGGT